MVGQTAAESGEIRRTTFASSDPAEVRDVIDRRFGSRLRLRGARDGDWRATISQIDTDSFSVSEARFPTDWTFTNDGRYDGVVVNILLEGRIGIDRGKIASRYQPGDTFLGTVPPERCRVQTRYIATHAVALPRSLLAEVSAASSDAPPDGWTFSSFEPVGDGDGWWRKTAEFVTGLLDDCQTPATPLMLGPAARLLAATALAVFPNNAAAEPMLADGRDARPATVRRAVSFIEANADRDITVCDIAAAALVTSRAVQLAFRRHLGTTPMAYLRRVRLDHAHRQLLTADPERDSVTTVAYRWGFASPSRFAADYRKAYGVSPSHTLRHG
jgi:AraC-like DNA-binding protein